MTRCPKGFVRSGNGFDRLGTKVNRLDAKVDAVSDGLQDLRRDLESHGMLPPSEAVG